MEPINYYKINENSKAEKLENGLTMQCFELERLDIFNMPHYKKSNLSYCMFCEYSKNCDNDDGKFIGICDNFLEDVDWINGVVVYKKKDNPIQ